MNYSMVLSEQNTSLSSPLSNSRKAKVVETLFWPRIESDLGVEKTATRIQDDGNDARTKSITIPQPFKVGFVIGWMSENYAYGDGDGATSTAYMNNSNGKTGSNVVTENVIVAGIVNVPIHDENNSNSNQHSSHGFDHTIDKKSVLKILEENLTKVQSMYHTIRSNIEYLKNMELPKSQQCLVQDLSVLGLFIDGNNSSSEVCSTSIDENCSDDILDWLSSTIDVGTVEEQNSTTRSSSTVLSTWKLFVLPHNKFSPPKVIVSGKHSATKVVLVKQVVYYNPNSSSKCSTMISQEDQQKRGVENIQVVWNHNAYNSFSTFGMFHMLQQQQTWLMRLTHADYVTQLVMNVDLNELLHLSPQTNRNCDDESTKSTIPSAFIRFIFRHSLFVRHCYNNYTTTLDTNRSVFPILKVIRRLLSKTSIQRAQQDPHPSSLSPLKDYHQIVYEHIVELNQTLHLSIDTMLGITIGTILFYYGILHLQTKGDDVPPCTMIVSTGLNLIQHHYALLHSYVQYLEDFPLGFKLNQDLLYNTGCEIQRLWKLHEYIIFAVVVPQFQSLSAILQSLPILMMSMFSYVFGASGCAAFLFDIIHFGTLHMSIFAWLTIRIYYYELYLLSTLWKLFCGKKCNILRNHRTDSMEYDSMQLLVGTILFTIVLFLFTTIFVGHIFYTILYLITIMMAVPILLLYTSLLTFPWGILWMRRRRPGWFTREVYLTDEVDHSQYEISNSMTEMDVTKLCFLPYTYHDILSVALFPRIQGSTRWIIQSLVLSMIGAPLLWNAFLDTILPMPNSQ